MREVDGVRGVGFAVWAPSAQRVSVTGDFNGWDGRLGSMRRMGNGIWEIFVPGAGEGALYKFEVKTLQGPVVLKSDPYGQAMELRPRTASKVAVRHYEFTDACWMADRAAGAKRRKPLSIYEVHLGSWRIRNARPDGGDPIPPARPLTMGPARPLPRPSPPRRRPTRRRAGTATASSPTCWSTTWPTSASPTSSCCR